MSQVYVFDSVYRCINQSVFVDNLELDMDCVYRDLSYLGKLIPEVTSLGQYIVRFLPFMDVGNYYIFTHGDLALNVVTGVYTESGDFSQLFSFDERGIRVM